MKKKLILFLLIFLVTTSCSPDRANHTNTDNIKKDKEAVQEDNSQENNKENSSQKEDNSEKKPDSTQQGNENSESNKDAEVVMYNDRKPLPVVFLSNRGPMIRLPEYDEANSRAPKIDLRGYDLRDLIIGDDRAKDLENSIFNTNTKWPDDMPPSFNPEKAIELGKDPGLRIKELHNKGITGKSVSIAIIDQPLLIEHVEYKDRLKLFEEIYNPIIESNNASMHGTAVASIAVGKNVGIAPEAKLYYISTFAAGEKHTRDFTYYAMSIDRVLEINKTLPEDEKIRVISLSIGWNSKEKGYAEMVAAVERAKEQGIFVVSSSLSETYGFYFHGLGRDTFKDPNKYEAYKPGYWWEKQFYEGTNEKDKEILLVPMDARSTASPIGEQDYVFYSGGGWSWCTPYIAGLYALACQVKPSVTPEEFWNTALATGETIELKKDGEIYKLGKIANPGGLIEKLQKSQ